MRLYPLRLATLSLLCTVLFVIAPVFTLGQQNAPQAPPGLFPFQTRVTDAFDTIDLSSLAISVSVPVTSKSPGPAPFTYNLFGQNILSPNGTWFLNGLLSNSPSVTALNATLFDAGSNLPL